MKKFDENKIIEYDKKELNEYVYDIDVFLSINFISKFKKVYEFLEFGFRVDRKIEV